MQHISTIFIILLVIKIALLLFLYYFKWFQTQNTLYFWALLAICQGAYIRFQMASNFLDGQKLSWIIEKKLGKPSTFER